MKIEVAVCIREVVIAALVGTLVACVTWLICTNESTLKAWLDSSLLAAKMRDVVLVVIISVLLASSFQESLQNPVIRSAVAIFLVAIMIFA